MTSPIVHITPKEQALMRENERLTQALRISAFTVETQAEQLAALKAQPVQEPVAWIARANNGNIRIWKNAPTVPPCWAEWGWKAEPLYAAPVLPAPLTDDQIYRINKNYGRRLDFARAIEAAVRTGGTG